MYNKNVGINNFANQKQGGENMSKELFVKAEEVASELGISKPYAYKLVREMNEELKQKGFITKGAQLGTVLSFMMAVTTLSLPSLIMLRKAVKPKLLALFIGICTIGIIIVGYLFNAFQFILI